MPAQTSRIVPEARQTLTPESPGSASAASQPPSPAPTPSPQPQPLPEGYRRFYLSVSVKFAIAVTFAGLWTGLAFWFSLPWIVDLSRDIGAPAAWIIVALVAYLPGYVVALMAMSLILDRQPPRTVSNPTSPLTIIVAAWNEENGMAETIRCIGQSDYAGDVTVILADNGSTDATAEIAVRAAAEFGVSLAVAYESRPGKSYALNTALQLVETPYVITVDADTLLHREALRRLISRLESAPVATVAVAGTVLVRNSRTNLLTRMQEWDYFLGIAAVKRMQGMYQATLVAQGAFSVYRTEQMREIGGWPDAIGEDIVVTWKLLAQGGRVIFEPTAVAFTDAPARVAHFMRQRARWARGMFEGLRTVPPWRQSRRLAGMIAAIDLLIPLLDIGYALIWLPGLVLFLFGYPAIVSAWALTVIPMTLIIYGALRRYQRRWVFGPLGLGVRRNLTGYLAFLVLYQVLCSTASIAGYAQFLAGTSRRWK
ncbi:biofilm PGA synthesis N-glycosyltransferase PgaC [Cryobacterium psychrotolerans]|uniref:Biofilm PGA synthesis N-glycosyltransferase PgaC n=1 Tax=Cryobacterium psychrotolerans TaxID=386301 RepID=A0A1G9EJ58_9MICO|nr:glycosyltransferase family 2 protein [Cryobacterium psychrotolerans]TFD88482.1 glycosyltransferase family 2 protein [Cryobacterium psychrotolerans]SDK76065.1 biofilm PGA synthesis N-glycosyltransferase PgaC [Cryobacterium psychrotolerans]